MKFATIAAVGMTVPLVAALPKTSTSSQAKCNVKGWDRGKPDAYEYLEADTPGWEIACVVACSADTKCKAFAIGQNECLLYSKKV